MKPCEKFGKKLFSSSANFIKEAQARDMTSFLLFVSRAASAELPGFFLCPQLTFKDKVLQTTVLHLRG